MKARYAITLTLVGLIAGLTLGWASTGIAATTAPAPAAASAACGSQLRLGETMRANGSRLLDIVARLTGMSTDEVVAARQAGGTFSSIASSKGVSEATVVSEAVAAHKAALAELVAAGSITQEQADAALANAESRLTGKVQTANPNCTGEGAGQGRGGMGAGQGCGQGGGGMGAGQGCGQNAGGACGGAGMGCAQ